jgi:hypothetical protein
MAVAHPERVDALIVQNAVAHNEGLGAIWNTRRAFWADRVTNESALRTNLLSLATTRTRHVGTDPNVELYDPDLWTDEFATCRVSRCMSLTPVISHWTPLQIAELVRGFVGASH